MSPTWHLQVFTGAHSAIT